MALIPIVEGHAEVHSIPVLMRRLGIDVARPFRVKRNLVVKPGELERAVVLAVKDRAPATAVLVLLDADDDCPAQLAPTLLERCAHVTDVPVSVVFAVRELEAWFLGAIESLRGQRGIRHDANYDGDPEARRGAKERVEALMAGSYVDVDDQPAMMASFDLETARVRCPSFDKLMRDLGTMGVLP
ncbi:MAG TPA: DUF4276 family protein [Longimicrobium sp.]|nr:DUF4276 family protein [Longimicrobium sp.]